MKDRTQRRASTLFGGYFRKPTILAIAFAVFTVSCDDNSNDNDVIAQAMLLSIVQSRIAIIGEWENDFGGTEAFDNISWKTESEFGDSERIIHEYDNAENIFYYQEDPNDGFNPDKFGRVRWHLIGERLFTCTEVFGEDTLQEARDNPTTSEFTGENDPTCGGFQWSGHTRK